MWSCRLRLGLLALSLCWVPTSFAVDLPVDGHRVVLRAKAVKPDSRRLRVVMRDAAIAAPLPDPTRGSRLVVSGGADAGQCFAEISLDPSGWVQIRGDGATRGWRYRPAKPGTQGVRSILVKPGKLVVRARGADWPCDLAAEDQRLPVRVELHVDETRFCAGFGGDIRRNEAGRFKARDAAAPAACAARELHLANLNLLHGLGCPPNDCRQADRIDLFFQWLVDAGCPDVVTLQEIFPPMVPLIEAQAATVCPFPYTVVYEQYNTFDDSIVLTRHPPVLAQLFPLHHIQFRHVQHVRIDHPLGPLDVFNTHLASGADGGPKPCASPCPQECVDAGATTNRECQAVQTALVIESVHDVSTPAVLAGDFNDPPGSFTYDEFVGRGWVDTYLEAGQPECDAASGVGCTTGRDSGAVLEIQSTDANVDRRIDFAFLVPPTVRSCEVEPAGDADGDGTQTQIFADDPNPFAACGAAPLPVCWPSDHEGNELDLNCN